MVFIISVCIALLNTIVLELPPESPVIREEKRQQELADKKRRKHLRKKEKQRAKKRAKAKRALAKKK